MINGCPVLSEKGKTIAHGGSPSLDKNNMRERTPANTSNFQVTKKNLVVANRQYNLQEERSGFQDRDKSKAPGTLSHS